MIDASPQKSLVTASSSAASPLSQAAAIATPADLGITTTQASSILGHSTLPLVYRQFEQQAAQQPHKTAIQFEGQLLSYGELNRRANQLAHYLVSLGAGPDILIAVCVERSLELMVTLLAIHKAGSAYLPLDLGYPSDRIQYILDNAQAPLLICHGHPNLPSGQAQIVDLADLHNQLEQYPSDNLSPSPKGDDLAYVIYTSGSTGNPKGVQIEHRSLSNLIQSMAKTPGLRPEDVALTLTTVAFDMSVPELFLALSVGATMKLLGRNISTDGQRLKAVLQESKITWMQGTPSTWRMLLAAGWLGTPGLKILIGGEATPRELADQLLFRCDELWNMYGPTETTVWSMTQRIYADDLPILLGQPLDNTQVCLMKCLANGELYPSAPGEAGEICIGGWGVARGYLNRPELNQEKFVSDWNSREIGAQLYRTGDLAQELADGSLQFIGRIDHQVKIRGHRVELGEVEAALLKHPQIANAAVIVQQDQSQSQQLIGYIVSPNILVGDATPEVETIPNNTDAAVASAKRHEAQLLEAPKNQCPSSTRQAVVNHWKTLWDDAYRLGTANSEPTFDFSGYRDTYTGDLLPASAIEEWTEHTVERILALKPRRVLEVGCGKGLLLFRAAPQCCRYVGVDVTPAAIAHLQKQLNQAPQHWSHVSLACAAADQLNQLTELKEECFDTIVINSVIQYFPDAAYLLTVFEQVIDLLQPGGKIFLGDVRNLDLLPHFHSTVQEQRLLAGIGEQPENVAEFKTLLAQHMQKEHELLLKPSFFSYLQKQFPRINRIVTQLKRGHERNELIDFRYDVVLHLDREDAALTSPAWSDWNQRSLNEIETHLTAQKPDCWGLRGIPNGRISRHHRLIEQLDHFSANTPWPKCLNHSQSALSLDPESLWNLGAALSYRTHITWGHNPGEFDVIFQKAIYRGEEQDWSHSSLAQIWSDPPSFDQCLHTPWQAGPIETKEQDLLAPPLCNQELRQFLMSYLPAYMVPSQFVLLEQLPLTPNNKIDRKALPQPTGKNILVDRTQYIAPASQVEQQLARLWEEILAISPLSKTANFFDCGGHSLLATQLMARIRETFNLELSLSVLFQSPILEDLAAAIEQAQTVVPASNAPPSQPALTQQIQQDCQLAADIFASGKIAPISTIMGNVLLTGSTGFVGGFLLQELLHTTDAIVYCLVRSLNKAEAQRKLENHLEQCQVSWEPYRDRIVAIPGDLAKPYLGLSLEQYQTFQSQIDAIYHNGAYVNLIYPYDELRAANVKSTIELLRLASQIKLKPVHYVSTLDVLHGEALAPGEKLTEDQTLPPWEMLSCDYARTKWVAEQLVMQARHRGIPCNIYRLGMTTGHSLHGFSNADDMIGRLIRGLVALAVAPEENFQLNLAPVDVVCQAIVSLSQQANLADHGYGQTFHVSNPHGISLGTIIKRLQSHGYVLTTVPYSQWFEQLMASDTDNALRPLLGDFGNRATEQGADFFKVLDLSQVTTDNIKAALPELQWPDLQRNVLDRYLSFFHRCGILSSSSSAYSCQRSLKLSK